MMQLIETTLITPQQKMCLMQLWNKEYPTQMQFETFTEFEHYLLNLVQAKHYLLTAQHENVVGWAFTFIREEQTWFAVIVDSSQHHQGLGSKLIQKLQLATSMLVGWVVDHEQYLKADGRPYLSPLGFYLKNGFSVSAAERLATDHLSAVKIQWQSN